MALLVIPARLVTVVLLLASGAAHRNSSLRVGEKSRRSMEPEIAKTPSDDARGQSQHRRRKNHHRVHFESSEANPHEPCGARISLEEHRMMDEAQEVWEEQNPDRNRRMLQGRSLTGEVKIDVWFHV